MFKEKKIFNTPEPPKYSDLSFLYKNNNENNKIHNDRKIDETINEKIDCKTYDKTVANDVIADKTVADDVDDGWHIIDYDEKEIIEIEKEQIDYIKSIVEQTLYSELLSQNIDYNKLNIISDMKINLKYRTIEISIQKNNIKKPNTIISICKNITSICLYTIGNIALLHPFKILGLTTLIYKIL